MNFNSLCLQILDTRILYVIFTEDKIYIGQTKDFYKRFKQHIYHTRNVMTGQKQENPSLNTTKNSNKRLYKHLARNNFLMIPIMRIYHTNCLSTEKVLIRTFGTLALNIEGNERMKTIPKIISSTSLKNTNARKTRKRKRKQKTTQTHSRPKPEAPELRTVMTATGEQTYIKNIIIPVLFTCNNNTYTNLLTILNTHINETITITIYPTHNKHMVHNTMIHICKFSYHTSKIIINKIPCDWKHITPLLCSSNHKQTLTITPTRTNTMTENIFLMIRTNQSKHKINSLISTMNDMIAEKLTIFFWMNLFRIANKFNCQKTTIKIRRFLKHYIYLYYNITTKEIIFGISLNIVLYFHPLINKHALSNCHKKIILCFTKNKNMIQNTYTTLKKT